MEQSPYTPPPYHGPLIRPADVRYARRRPEAWHAARERFEAGESAGSIARALGLGRSQLYQRAKREGWSRPDQLEPADLLAELMEQDDGSEPPPDPAAMTRAAWRGASRAIALGQIAEARAWTRLVRDLQALAPPSPDKPDGPDSNFSSPVPEPPPPADPAVDERPLTSPPQTNPAAALLRSTAAPISATRSPIMKRPLALLLAAALTAASPTLPVLTGDAQAQSASLKAADRALVERAGAYLNGLKSARGRFTQTDPNGRVTTGAFSLKRPGKVRFQYDKPSGLLIVADGRNASIYDSRLKTFDQSPLSRSPLSLFLSNDISVTKGSISEVTRSGNGFAFSARDRGGRADGYVTLSFTDAPLRLTGWTVVDGQGRRTRVRLNTLTPATLPDSLFVLNNPTRAGGR